MSLNQFPHLKVHEGCKKIREETLFWRVNNVPFGIFCEANHYIKIVCDKCLNAYLPLPLSEVL